MISLRIILGLFHLTCVIRTGSSCGGNSALKVVEMCKGGSTTDRHFYLRGSPAGGVQRCDCNLTITGAAATVYFTPVSMTNNGTTCGGTLTLVDGSRRDCGWTSTTPALMYQGTNVVSYAFNSPDVRFCVEIEITAAAANISTECPLPITTTTQPSQSITTAAQTTTVNFIASSISTTTALPAKTSPLHTDNFTSSSTSTPSSNKPLTTSTLTTVSTSTTMAPTVSSSERRTTSPVTNTKSSADDSKPGTTLEQTSFPVAAVAGGVGGGLLLLLVVGIVVILCYSRGRRVDKQEDDKQLQEESKGPTEVITVTNSLYESSADMNNAQPTKPLTTVEQQVNNPTVEGKLHPGLTSDITPATVDQHNGKSTVADQHCGTTGSTAPQDETPDEHRDGPPDMYAVVIKPKKSLEATNIAKESVHTDPENVSKDKSPPPIDPAAIYAKVNKPSPKTKL
ncbi:mucin-5AC-like [Haliotis rubra]|uniref:mucin-5AC-like n=1 Tax=Haliotis rubra TaxID=36100 RepID=UPI001EE5F0CB|nr:mucin-5AC-like [Haliotis rubra]